MVLGTFQGFLNNFNDTFKEEEQAQSALFKLQNLRQSKNMLVEELNTEFRLLIGQAGLTMPTTGVNPPITTVIGSNKTLLINSYRRALNPSIGTKFLMGKTKPRSLAEWMAKAVMLDNNWRQANMMRGGNCQSGSSNNQLKDKQTFNFCYQPSCDPMAMDINALSPEECQFLMKEGSCFFCKKTRHCVEDCNKKPSLDNNNGGNQNKNQRNFNNKSNNNTKKFESNKGKHIAKHICSLAVHSLKLA